VKLNANLNSQEYFKKRK